MSVFLTSSCLFVVIGLLIYVFYVYSNRYEPLDPSQKNKVVELCSCCACFPYEEEEEPYVMDTEEPPEHPYMADTTQGLGKDGTSASISSGIKRSKREIA